VNALPFPYGHKGEKPEKQLENWKYE